MKRLSGSALTRMYEKKGRLEKEILERFRQFERVSGASVTKVDVFRENGGLEQGGISSVVIYTSDRD